MKPLYFIALCLLMANIADAQTEENTWKGMIEAGIFAGGSAYSGDVTEKRVEYQEMHLGYGAFMRYHFSKNLAVRLNLLSGGISGDDAHASTRMERSFRFSSSVFEVSTVGEWKFLSKERFTSTGLFVNQIVPYVYAGVGMAFSRPDAEYYGSEALRDKYLKVPFPESGAKTQFIMAPIGGGFRFEFFDRLVLGLDGGLRPVFSDDLDGVNKNGNPKQGDWYYFFGATASFLLSHPEM